jgi:WD40 repeat protein
VSISCGSICCIVCTVIYSLRSVVFRPFFQLILRARKNQTFANVLQDGVVIIWCLQRFTCSRKLNMHDSQVNSLAFAPDGRRLASAAADASTKIIDVELGSELMCINPLSPVNCLLFNGTCTSWQRYGYVDLHKSFRVTFDVSCTVICIYASFSSFRVHNRLR